MGTLVTHCTVFEVELQEKLFFDICWVQLSYHCQIPLSAMISWDRFCASSASCTVMIGGRLLFTASIQKMLCIPFIECMEVCEWTKGDCDVHPPVCPLVHSQNILNSVERVRNPLTIRGGSTLIVVPSIIQPCF